MATIDEIKVLLDDVKAEDVAEDAAFQAQIDSLSTSNAALVAERDALLAERNSLLAEKSTTVVELRTILDALTARVAALEA